MFLGVILIVKMMMNYNDIVILNSFCPLSTTFDIVCNQPLDMSTYYNALIVMRFTFQTYTSFDLELNFWGVYVINLEMPIFIWELDYRLISGKIRTTRYSEPLKKYFCQHEQRHLLNTSDIGYFYYIEERDGKFSCKYG